MSLHLTMIPSGLLSHSDFDADGNLRVWKNRPTEYLASHYKEVIRGFFGLTPDYAQILKVPKKHRREPQYILIHLEPEALDVFRKYIPENFSPSWLDFWDESHGLTEYISYEEYLRTPQRRN